MLDNPELLMMHAQARNAVCLISPDLFIIFVLFSIAGPLFMFPMLPYSTSSPASLEHL